MSKRIIKSSIHFEAPAYWATIAYARSWLATDGVRLAHIQKRAMAGSNLPYLTPRDVRSIAVEYNFNRGIRHGNTSAEGLANLVNEIRQTWPDNLLERADKCEYVINNASKNEFTRGSQSSAVTKLMWFLAPRGWTLYDRFARKGLASKQVFDEIESCSIPNEDSIKLMKYFYRKLEKRLIPLAQA